MILEGKWREQFEAVREFVRPDPPIIPGFFSAAIAGGWPRDMVAGRRPNDLDVFVEPLVFDRIKQADVLDHHDEKHSQAPGRLAVASHHTLIDGLLVQIIAVPDVLGAIRAFDAHCNMMWVDLAVDSGRVWSASMWALRDAKDQVWRANVEAGEPFSSLVERARHFRRLGFTIVWPE